jgi:hypothetical protein
MASHILGNTLEGELDQIFNQSESSSHLTAAVKAQLLIAC